VDTSVSVPSLYQYVQQTGGSRSLYGVAAAVDSFCGIFFFPLYGYLADRYNVKPTHALKHSISSPACLIDYLWFQPKIIFLVSFVIMGAGGVGPVLPCCSFSVICNGKMLLFRAFESEMKEKPAVYGLAYQLVRTFSSSFSCLHAHFRSLFSRSLSSAQLRFSFAQCRVRSSSLMCGFAHLLGTGPVGNRRGA